jgi:hypothetical protein
MSDVLKAVSDAFSYNQKMVVLLESELSKTDKKDKNFCSDLQKTIQHFKGAMAGCLKLLDLKN